MIVSGGDLDQYSYIDKKFILEFGDKGSMSSLLKGMEDKYKKYKTKSLLILDDPIGLLDFEAKWFLHLASTFRQFDISVVLITQCLNKEIPTFVRNISSGCAYFRQDSLDVLRVFYKAFCNSIGSLEKLQELNSKLDFKKHEFILYLKNQPVEDNFKINVLGKRPEFFITDE